jgi:hypothetical protein
MSGLPDVSRDEIVSRRARSDHPDLMVVAFCIDNQGPEGALVDCRTPRRDPFL